MLIIQSLFSRLRNIQTRNRGEIVIPASAPQESGLRLDNDWLFVQQKGEGWMRPTFVLQHLHFLVSLLILLLFHTRAVRKEKSGTVMIGADIKTNMTGRTTNLAIYFCHCSFILHVE